MPNIFVKLIRAVSGAGRTETLKFTGRLDMDQNAEGLVYKFLPLFSDEQTDSRCILDFTEVEFIYPSAILFLLCVQETLLTKKIQLEVSLIEGSSIHEYLTYCGFGDHFDLPEFPETKPKTILGQIDVFRMKSAPQLINPQRIAEEVVDWFELKQPLSPGVESNMIDSIDELLRNIVQHSSYSTYYLLGQAYPNSKRIRLTVYDNGVGIKSHITKLSYGNMHKRFKELISEQDFNAMKTKPANIAIEHAAKYEVSGTDYSKNSGAGLDFLINTLSPPTNGLVSILSEDGYVKWKSGGIVQNFALPYYIKGTLVSVTINCDPQTRLRYQEEEAEEPTKW